VAIPYATWANRGRGQMIVWLAADESVAKPTPRPTPATTAMVTTSAARGHADAINDGEEPTSSADPTSYFDWWPRRGSSEWVEYAFEKRSTIARIGVYWFDDVGRGQVCVPASWRVLYKSDGAWKPLDTRDEYGIEKDRFNTVTFAPVTTTGLRLELTTHPEFSAGIQEWTVE
jgi:uncharacterized protein